jgi:uncharacterized protein with HEPN domain
MRDYTLYLRDILESMEAIEKLLEGMEFGEFKEDDKTAGASRQAWGGY